MFILDQFYALDYSESFDMHIEKWKKARRKNYGLGSGRNVADR